MCFGARAPIPDEEPATPVITPPPPPAPEKPQAPIIRGQNDLDPSKSGASRNSLVIPLTVGIGGGGSGGGLQIPQ